MLNNVFFWFPTFIIDLLYYTRIHLIQCASLTIRRTCMYIYIISLHSCFYVKLIIGDSVFKITSHMFRNTNLIECLGDRVCYKFSS
jgi:hypothetical protein